MEEPSQTPPSPQGLSYVSAEPTDAYQELCFPAGASIHFPETCCGCLKATNTKYTVRGNRVRFRSGITGAVLRELDGTSDFFEMKMPICNRCWRAYRARRRSWFWLGPAIGSGIGLAIGSLILLSAAREYGVLGRDFVIPVVLLFLGAVAGLALNSLLLRHAGRPPVKIHLHTALNEMGIRFQNPAYVPRFLRAQETAADEAAARLGAIDAASQPSAPVPRAWYYLQGEETVGPIPFRELKELAATGQLSPSDSVYTDSQPDWLQAGKVPGLFPSHLDSTNAVSE